MITDARSALADDGPLANAIEGFAPRPQQQQMAEAVEQALENSAQLIAEAGTGTGKTFAYLIPALLSGKRVIISTGTRTLQDQLYHRDLPTVREALGVPIETALLKGRSNYLCYHRLETAESEGRINHSLLSDLAKVRRWAAGTRKGDIAEVSGVAENSYIWPLVTSTVDNCLGQECPTYKDCCVLKARRDAQEAELVVVNHHLLFADMALKEEGFGELLPGADAFILDEAHQLPEIATIFFGQSLSSRQLGDIARDAIGEYLREGGVQGEMPSAIDSIQKHARDLRLALGMESRRAPWATVATAPKVEELLALIEGDLGQLEAWLEEVAPRGKGLENCWRRVADVRVRLKLLTESDDEGQIKWFETRPRSFTLHMTPLDVAPLFTERRQRYPSAWIYTSATLAVGEGFDHYISRLGLDEAETLRLDSPFDYANNTQLYIPKDMPEPSSRDYTHAVVEAALPVLQASGGRAFLLFTSHRALKQAAELLHNRVDFPLLVQGDAPRAELLDRFRQLGNALLLGTGSFWEGVDVRGEALSLVIIDKLPFAAPDDPVLSARIDSIRRNKGNPFMEYQVPTAVITLKQGVGRLIRDVSDSGVLMLCDPRLYSKAYGRVFLKSLPPMPPTRELEQVQRFLKEIVPRFRK
ncbi:helicase [Solemya pervernicosa gill symbiont]|uniref:DNA 5'-3' helicase n=2 Tax=Gammaproteobacteria incertae sedis TaxID=118884 RepID=A0A1T2L9B2_9GAMM|nr:ATP-dependent DNA helicase [Solemya pervernicosa gill symbiont]OOZ41624.1 helicase [Solemya pervernicosa gill symbiont]QKQ28250.1 ATP-dependent DNA helicase [Candidatus Reidiella endopervernicosa]